MDRRVILLAIIITSFVFSVSLATLYAQIRIMEANAYACSFSIPALIPLFSSFGVLIGLIVYYLLSPKIEKISLKKVEAILEILEPRERETIKMLIENGGELSQAKISSKLGKVNTHRVLEKLIKRGVVSKIPLKKTNKIKLNDKFKSVFQ